MSTRRPLALLVASVLAASLLAGCGGSSSDGAGSDGGGGAASPSGSGAGSGAFEPVTIEHSYGSTQVDEAPERIVSLDGQWTDVLIALGHPPAGYLADPSADGGSFPWRADGLDDSTAIEATDALPFEKVAAVEPDLIVVASYLIREQADYDKLAAIAPTIAGLSDNQVDTWQEIAGAAGPLVGEPDAAGDLIGEVEGASVAFGEELPGLAGKTFAFVNYVPGDKFYVLSDPEDGAAVLFDQLGMDIAPSILEAGEGTSGRVELSLENAGLLDADVLLMLSNGGDPSDVPGFDDLAAVQAGAVVDMDYALAVALNTPSPLSIPYALEQIRPALEAAAE